MVGLSAEELLELLLKYTPEPILLRASDYRLLFVNDAAAGKLGMSRIELIGRRERDIPAIDPDFARAREEETDRLLSSNEREELSFEEELNGQKQGFRALVIPVESSNGERMSLTMMQSVTGLEGAHQALEFREALLRATLDSVSNGTWEFDAVNGVLKNDARWLEIFGLSESEHTGTVDTFVARLHVEDRDSVLAGVEECVSGASEGYVSEHRMTRADDGRVIWVRDAGRVVKRGADGRATYMVGAVIDITELKQQERKLAQALDIAEAASYSKTRFLANMSHELRTPMNGVLGMMDALRDTELSNEQLELLDTARSSAKNLVSILNDILDSSKLEASALKIESIPVSIPKLLDEVKALFVEFAKNKSVELYFKYLTSSIEWVLGDPVRLRQVLTNLVGNALKFTNEGTVSVTAEYQVENLKLSVCDTGVGIPEQAIPRLFERFTQADVSTTRQYGGTGLGLSICKQLIDLMGGDIKVASELGHGTCIDLKLPLPPCSPCQLISKKNSPALLCPLNILVVDDVLVNRKVVTRMLEKAGHKVQCAENGQEALEVVARSPCFDVVLMDIQMPIMDGVEATKAIRNLEGEASHIKIIALTANAMSGDREKYLAAGMDDYAAKPIDRTELFDVLARVCGEPEF